MGPQASLSQLGTVLVFSERSESFLSVVMKDNTGSVASLLVGLLLRTAV